MKKFRFGILFLVLIALSGFTVFAKTHKDDIVVIDRIEYTLEEKDKYSAELFVEEDGLYIIKVLSLSSVEGVRPVISLSVHDEKNQVIGYKADKKYITEDGFEFIAGLKDGEYKLEIENASKFGDVSFVIETDFVEQDYIEEAGNSSFEKASELLQGKKYFGGISMENETDYFSFEMQYDGYAFVQMYTPDVKYFTLYDKDKNEIGNIDLSIEDENLIYEQRIGLARGQYYISVTPYEDYCNPIYTLEVLSKADDGFEKEYNNDEKNATPIKSGKEYQGNLFGIEDEDIFVFSISEDARVKVDFFDTIVSRKGHYGVTLSDGKNIIFKSDDSKRESLSLNLGKGTYYFVVTSLGEERFTSMGYKLKVTSDKSFAPVPEQEPKVEETELETELETEAKEETNEVIPFDDVTDKDWYYSDVMEAKSLGLIDGIGNNKYNPKGNVTLAEVIVIAVRIKNSIGGANTEITNSPVGKWYNSYITFAVNSGIFKMGDFDDFERNATRKEVAYIFANVLGDIETNENISISDVDEGTKYGDSIKKLYSAGILKGDGNGSFRPDDSITRAEAAAILLRVYKNA